MLNRSLHSFNPFETLQEKKEKERAMERSHMGPGATEYMKPFGTDTKTFTFGRHIREPPNTNPGVGYYDVEKADSVVKPRTAVQSPSKVARFPAFNPPETDAGKYNHHKPFGTLP